ncbi:MAG: ATP-dependent RecD-like DNA helicase [Candidatus Hydrogenedentes bacterium]|nr:ATP-dependent RecD-like DNA helicase [Candidatus Hydrogenedentota bacterium]
MPDFKPHELFPDAEPVTIEGVVERIVFESPDTGFFVARLGQEGSPDLTTFVGNLMAISPGETIRITGHWVDDKKFGRQVRVDTYETILPSSVTGIEKYLGSGLIHGIGPTYAKRLVGAFGVETLKVIDEQPERLTSVEGIGAKRAAQIREAWAEQKSIQSIMVFLQGHGIGTGQAVKIYKRYGDGAVAVLRENPYRLAEEITGIGFSGADKIAASLGIKPDSPERLQAGLNFSLQQAVSEGHVFLNEEDLTVKAATLLGVEKERLPGALATLVAGGSLVREEDKLFLSALHQAEVGCDHHIKRLLRAPGKTLTIDIEKAIQWVEKTQEIQLSPEQNEAIRMAAKARMMVITGGPGTGKTTLLNSLLAILEKKGVSAVLAAPTGRAAKRMEAATGREAKTIHRLLEFSPKAGGFARGEHDPLQADLVVIDECSMVDIHLMHSLLQAIANGARLFLVGDVDQLPSVGPGNVLMDIIASNVIPTVRLKTVFRQAAESGIIANAHRINRGEMPQFNSEDFFFVERPDPSKALETVLELIVNRIPKKFGLDPLRDVQLMSPMHRGETGVENLNRALQDALNPKGAAVPGKNFRLGDKVIQLRNNYELDVYNGDVGIVTLLEEEVKELHVQFDDRVVLYSFDDLDNLGLAYAITVHKSQGSEYPAVILPLSTQHYLLLQRNVLYTAITRGKRLVIIVGDPKALNIALRNTDVSRRNTRLAERLRNEV